MEYNKYSTNTEIEIKDLVFIKKNNSTYNISLLETKILELKQKLEFYKKYEDNLNTSDLCLINKTTDAIVKIIQTLDKNFINKGQFRSSCTKSSCANSSKQIEFEF